MRKLLLSTLVLVSAIGVVGCRSTVPVRNVEAAPIYTNTANPKLDDISKAIIRAGTQLGWQMRQKGPGFIEGELHLRKHMARVHIKYDTKTYNITYADSYELKYDGQNIHPNYNGWIQNLDNAIRSQLSAL
jgi:hypothetical protein